MSTSMEQKRFQKRKEDFTCEHCGCTVRGTGYTNHCPKCLYSKHVDVNPGDRSEHCQGLMRPIGSRIRDNQYTIEQECTVCGKRFRVKAADNDNTELLISLSTTILYD